MYILSSILFAVSCFAFVFFGMEAAVTLFSLARTANRQMLDILGKNIIWTASAFTYMMAYLFIW